MLSHIMPGFLNWIASRWSKLNTLYALFFQVLMLLQAMHKLEQYGGCLDPHACFLLQRGMATLKLRVEQQNKNGLAIAQFLSSHDKVRLASSPNNSSLLSTSRGYCFTTSQATTSLMMLHCLSHYLNCQKAGLRSGCLLRLRKGCSHATILQDQGSNLAEKYIQAWRHGTAQCIPKTGHCR